MAEPWSDGDVPTATELAGLPWGVMAYATASGAQSGISSVTDLTSCSVTFMAVSTRLYRTTLYVARLDQSASTGVISLTIADGASSALKRADQTTGSSERSQMIVQHYESGLSGSTTRKGRLAAGAGTVATVAGHLPIIIVEDLGAA